MKGPAALLLLFVAASTRLTSSASKSLLITSYPPRARTSERKCASTAPEVTTSAGGSSISAISTQIHTVPLTWPWDETFDVSSDPGTTVDDQDYQVPFKLTGTIDKLTRRSG
jgi:hypothetical protein